MYKAKTYRPRKYVRRYKKTARTLSKPAKKQVYSIAKRVQKANTELKFTAYEFPFSVSNSWTGPAFLITHPPQGIKGYNDVFDLQAGQSQRIGNTITPYAIQVNYTVTGADSSNVVRIIFFQWLMDDQTAPQVGDILMGTGTSSSVLQMRNYVNKKNYKILYDKTHTTSTNAGNNLTIVKHVIIPAKRLKIKQFKYLNDSSSGFAPNLIKGNIYYMMASDSAVISHPQVYFNSRMLFTDA